MDISNSTNLDTKFKVTSGEGSSRSRTSNVAIEESVSWPTLPAGARLSVSPKSAGPWTIYFYVQGRGFTVTTESADDRLTLMQSGGGFHVQVG